MTSCIFELICPRCRNVFSYGLHRVLKQHTLLTCKVCKEDCKPKMEHHNMCAACFDPVQGDKDDSEDEAASDETEVFIPSDNEQTENTQNHC